MALAIATNNAALNAAASASSVNRDMETSMARLSTGKRINSASDDAAGVAISSRLSAEIRGTDQAIRNSLDGQALIDTAEGAHKEIENILQRMREISVQAANDTNNDQDRANLQAELTAMTTEIDRISSTTTWAGENLMADTATDFSFQVGTATGPDNQITVTIDGMSSTDLSLSGSSGGVNKDQFIIGQHTDTSNNDAQSDSISLSGSSTGPLELALVDVATDGETAGAYTLELQGVTVTLTGDEQGDQLLINNAFGSMGVNAAIAADIDTSFDHATFGTATDGTNAGGTAYLTLTLPANSGSGITVEAGGGQSAPLNALDAIEAIDDAIQTVNIQRSELGAVSNRLNHTVNNLTNISSNLSAAKGGIEDADFALETTNLAKNQILQQASTAMLAQANASKQNVLSLLQG
jgi:flagellin